jgi:hypothetical protein
MAGSVNASDTSEPDGGGFASAGGLVGDGVNVEIAMSFNNADITADSLNDYAHAGGIAGCLNAIDNVNRSSIDRSYNTGNIIATSGGLSSVFAGGGIVGYVDNTVVANVYSTGTVSARDAGGLIGNMASYSSIEYGYATGDITASAYAGGITGSVGVGGDINSTVALMDNLICDATSFGRIYGGGLATSNNNYAFEDMLINTAPMTVANIPSDKNGGSVAVGDYTYPEFNTDIWAFTDGDGIAYEYPRLKGME